jgi:hypothetical protein
VLYNFLGSCVVVVVIVVVDVDLVVVVVAMLGLLLKISQIVEKLTLKEGIEEQHGGTYLIPKNRGTETKRNI